LAKAFSRSMKSIRPVHGKRIILTFEEYLMRLVPVKSAPAYVHQLHTKATTFGSKSDIYLYFDDSVLINIH